MKSPEKAYPGVMICFKIFIFGLPATLLPEVKPTHGHTAFGLSLVLGAILQAFISPRKHGLVFIAGTLVFTLIYSLI